MPNCNCACACFISGRHYSLIHNARYGGHTCTCNCVCCYDEGLYINRHNYRGSVPLIGTRYNYPASGPVSGTANDLVRGSSSDNQLIIDALIIYMRVLVILFFIVLIIALIKKINTQ